MELMLQTQMEIESGKDHETPWDKNIKDLGDKVMPEC